MGRDDRRSRHRGNNRDRQDRSKSRSRKSNDTPKKKKTLGDHAFYVGSAKNASDCVTNSNYIINYIQKEYSEGLDIADALREGKDYDFTTDAPKLKISEKTDAKELASETAQFQREFDIDYKNFSVRKEIYRKNKGKASALFWDRCSLGMRSKLHARDDFDIIKNDPIVEYRHQGTFNEL